MIAYPIRSKPSSVRESAAVKKAQFIATEPRLPPAPTTPETMPSAARETCGDGRRGGEGWGECRVGADVDADADADEMQMWMGWGGDVDLRHDGIGGALGHLNEEREDHQDEDAPGAAAVAVGG